MKRSVRVQVRITHQLFVFSDEEKLTPGPVATKGDVLEVIDIVSKTIMGTEHKFFVVEIGGAVYGLAAPLSEIFIMKYSWRHCYNCHHEFSGPDGSRCDWCGGTSYLLAEISPVMPKLIQVVKKIVQKMKNQKLN